MDRRPAVGILCLMAEEQYDMRMDTKFGPLEQFDVLGFASTLQPWINQTLVNVNDCVVRLGVLDGDFHWHKHDQEDEFFYVVEGRLKIDFENGAADLGPGQGVMVPRGAMHCPHAIGRTVVLMFEAGTVVPTGD
jgi:mannose-6-phosphate isomerase-like protein (cupin superfamily)